MRDRFRLLHALVLSLAALLATTPARASTLPAYVVDTDGKPVADAVVFAHPRRGSPPATTAARERAIMDQRDSEFVPYVLPVRVGTPVYFPNSDNFRHHVYSFSPAKRFELPLYKGSPAEPVLFDKPGPVALGCNIHDWMVGYIYVLDTPYFGKTGASGETRLVDLPPQEYRLRVWHPRLRGTEESTERRVSIGAGEAARVKFSIALKPDLRKQRPVADDSSGGTGYNY